MEFVEVLKATNRMCKSHERCNDCPAFENCIKSVSFKFDDKHIKQYEETVKKWNEEHPLVTNLDKIREVFGDAVADAVEQNPCGWAVCPSCPTDCHDCEMNDWNEREYKPPKKEE